MIVPALAAAVEAESTADLAVVDAVSAAERAKCIRMMIDHRFGTDDFARPGHINPLRSRDGGVLVRTGQTEGSVDLCRLAGLYPAAVIIEIMRDDGEMARVPDLEKLAKQHNIKMCSVAQIIEYRLAKESLVRRLDPVQGRTLRTAEGEFTLIAYESVVDPQPHLALTVGGVGALDAHGKPIPQTEPTLVRMHSRDLLGDIFGDIGSTSGPHSTADLLHASMRAIQTEGRGAIIYLRPEQAAEGRPALNSIRRPSPETGFGTTDTPDLTAAPMLQRDFGVGSQILLDLGLTDLRLLTNRPANRPGLDAFGLRVVECVPLPGQ
jgi:3,4-dihydroxy 2-butanone 4-phosphate synthase/GTP cyclohydrolase II